MASFSLQNVEFGAPAAERDAGLLRYFVNTDSFKRLSAGQRTIVLGPRGSGKSALFRKLADEEKQSGALVIQLSPDDYSYELLQKTLLAEGQGSWAKQGAYAAAWKYHIYILVMKSLASDGGFKKGAAARLYSYIRDKHANFDKNPVATLISYIKRLEGLKIGQYEAGVKTRELESLYKLEEIEPLLPDLVELCSRRRAVVMVDELDKGWDASEDAVNFVAGLFQAAVSVNARVPNLRVIISLRRELYDSIPALYEDAQKVRDLIEIIEWNEPQLLELITRRIEDSAGFNMTLETNSSDREHRAAMTWGQLFAPQLDYRKTNSFNYIVDRTLFRPRELIQFCNDIKEVAIRGETSLPINYNIISRAELPYSESRLKDIAAEYRFQFPGLLSVFETFRGMCYNFSRNELEVHCMTIAVGEAPVDPEARGWSDGIEPDRLVDILWRVGFIRGRAVGGLKARRRSGSSYLGSHQISGLNLRNISMFHVHPMFRSHLGLKEPKGRSESSE